MNEIKNTAPGAANTESGKSKSTNFSLSEKPADVKAPQVTAQELASVLLRLIVAMRRAHINEHSIVDTLVLVLGPGKDDDPIC